MRGKKLIVGFLVLLITSSIIYIALQGEGVKLRVDKDKTTLYVFEDSRWKIGGREYNKLFDGTRRLYRDISNVKIYTHINETTNTTTIIRETPYKRGPVIRDTYYFKGNVKDKKLFPIYHKVEVYNASGLFYRYEVRDLVYSGPTYKLNGSTHLRFGRNVDVTLNPGYRWAWVYKSGIVKAQYDVESDYEVFYVKLFDPDSWWNFSWSYRQAINISNTAGDLTNYPVYIYLTSTRVGSHFNWSNNGDDLRFIDSSDSELDYYIKSWSSSGHTAKIWVEIPSLSDDTNTTIYMYYGNSEADPQSNGSATFDFFDDFEDGNLDGWNFWGNNDWEISTTHYEGSYGAQNKDIDDNEMACMYRLVSVSMQGEISYWWLTSSEEDSDFLKFYLDDTLKASYSGAYWWEDWSFALSSGSHKIEWCYEKDPFGSEFADTGYVDYIIVRKDADPEPSVSSFGEEESYLTITTLYLDEVSADRYYEQGTVAVLKAKVTDISGVLIPDALVCLDIDQVGYGNNYVCDNGTVEYNLTANAVLGEFNDSTTVKNLTINLSENTLRIKTFGEYSGTLEIFYYEGKVIWDDESETDQETDFYSYHVTNPDNAHDENWSSYARLATPFLLDAYTIENFTIPSGKIPKYWKFKAASSSGTQTIIVYYWSYSTEKWEELYRNESMGDTPMNFTVSIPCDAYSSNNKTFYLNFNKYDEIQSAYINITGFQDPDWPLNPKIYVNNTLVDSAIGYLGRCNQTLNEFSNGKTTENIRFSGVSTTNRYLGLPKTANVSSAHLDITGKWDSYWTTNMSLVDGLNDTGFTSSPEVFFKDGTWYLIAGSDDIFGYHWNGTSWVTDSDIINGITINDTTFHITPTVFFKDGTWYLIHGSQSGDFSGYHWNGTSWVTDSDIISGLIKPTGPLGFGQDTVPEVYHKNNTWYLIQGNENGSYYGYHWNGSSWELNSSVVCGLESPIIDYPAPAVFSDNNAWYCIVGSIGMEYEGQFYYLFTGFHWNGTCWITNSSVIEGLSMEGLFPDGPEDSGTLTYPDVYFKDNVWYLITGEMFGKFAGFQRPYVINPFIDVAESSGVPEWNWSGYFGPANGTQTVDLNSTLINDYLNNCSEDYCYVPLLFYSGSAGVLEISNIEVNYTYVIDPTRNINATVIQDYLNAQSSIGYYNIPIKISSETNSTIQVNNINITYHGSDNITVTAHFDGNADYSASNDTHVVRVVYSGFNTSIPANYGYLEFVPISPTDKNVSAAGMLETKPAINISWLNYDQPADLYMKINETHPCINITVSTTYDKSDGYILDTSYIHLDSNKNITNNTYLYLWADYACNYTEPYWRWWLPEFLLKAVCTNCVKGD